jgi:hypothetical protein
LCSGLKSKLACALPKNFFGKNAPTKSDAFNEGNRTLMPWAVQREWLWVFNCHRQLATLVTRAGNDLFLLVTLSKEEVTQGDPLAMVMHGAGLLPLIQTLEKLSLTCVSPGMQMTRGLADVFRRSGSALRSSRNLVPQQGSVSQRH